MEGVQADWRDVAPLQISDGDDAGIGSAGATYRRDSLYVVVPISIVYALIFFTGLIGNVSTCVVIACNKCMRTATNYFLFSLAVSDLLLLISGLPSEMYYIWSNYPYVLGETFCVLQSFAAETSANATVLTITTFTIERYVAICHPFLSRTSASKLSRAVRYVIAIWLFALCLAVPQAIQFGLVHQKFKNGTLIQNSAACSVKRAFVDHAFELSTILLFIVPMTVITVLYVLIGLKLRDSLTGPKRNSPGASDRAKSNIQRNVVKMLVAVVVAFFVGWAPFHAQRLLAVYAENNKDSFSVERFQLIYASLTYASGVLYYLSTAINPLLYNLMSNKFRDAFKDMISGHCGSALQRRIQRHRPAYNSSQTRSHRLNPEDLPHASSSLSTSEEARRISQIDASRRSRNANCCSALVAVGCSDQLIKSLPV